MSPRRWITPAMLALTLAMALPSAAAPTFLALYDLPDRAIAWPEALAILGQGDVVLVGEQHGDPETHRVELATLQALVGTGKPVALSLEMFEADVQPVLDAYLMGAIDEGTFLAQSRPWPNYKSDYRPLVEYAKAHRLPVIAANVPRPLAAKVAREDFVGLATLPWEQARHAAIPSYLDGGAPWHRFQKAMGGHGEPASGAMWRMYAAQSLKDATMARSIATALTTLVPGGRVLHVQGRFHSDYGAGVPAYLRPLLPDRTLRIFTVVPVATAAAATPQDKAGLADIVGFVLAEPGTSTK